MFDTILFDLDGTISSSGPGITRSVSYALNKFGIQVDDLSSLNRFVGPPLTESFSQFYGLSPEDCQKAIGYYRERYSEKGVHETQCYAGICELIRSLKAQGRTVALATSKPTVFAKMILEEYGITDYFDVILGSELDGARSEKIEVMTQCLEMLGVDNEKKKHTVMVGDRFYDIEGAKSCSVASIAVTYGYANPGELEATGADYIVSSVEELSNLLLSK